MGTSGYLLAFAAMTLLVSGCGAPIANFKLNKAFIDKQEKENDVQLSSEQKDDIATILTGLFGTPDEPFVPAGTGMEELVDVSNLELAAGPVSSDRLGKAQGLYREHCVHCHGTSGDGNGPTAAWLNPYPRDYRPGLFKFKSTPISQRPTHGDLKKVLINGVAGTAMPSFKLLPDGEVEALVDYVKYLAIRGEVERGLIEQSTAELDEGDSLLSDELIEDTKEIVMEEILATVVGKWQKAETMVTSVPARPDYEGEELLASIEKGKQLFYGKVANCYTCHGDSQLGDGQVDDYDAWIKDYAADWIKETDPAKKESIHDRLVNQLDALPPRNIKPRNLRAGIYRGGRRPVDLYWRIHNGIEGSPMPQAAMKQMPTTPGLTPDDLWHLVNYIQSLPYEAMSTTGPDVPVYTRSRM